MTARPMRVPAWLVAASIVAGIAVPPVVAAQKAARKSKSTPSTAVALTWPLPPEQPRVRYVASYHGRGDFKAAKRPSRFAKLLLGDADPGAERSETLVKPYGIAVGPSGQVIVTDTAARRVFAFDMDRKTLAFIGEGRTGRLSKPIGVAVDGSGRVFVADATLKRVFAYGNDGEVALSIGRDGELENPSGIAVDREGERVYVADAVKHQVMAYSTLDGSLIRAIGKRGGEPGEFNFPTNLTVDHQGRLYVADTMNFRIQTFDRDGRPVAAFGELGDGLGQLNRPKGVAVDSEGHVYVVDASFNNFQIFDQQGQLLLFVGQGGPQPGEFSLPAGIFIDEHDRIYVADQGNARIQIFQYIKAGAGPVAGERNHR